MSDFNTILRAKLHYLEGLADGLEETPRKALHRWIENVRKMLNSTERDGIEVPHTNSAPVAG